MIINSTLITWGCGPLHGAPPDTPARPGWVGKDVVIAVLEPLPATDDAGNGVGQINSASKSYRVLEAKGRRLLVRGGTLRKPAWISADAVVPVDGALDLFTDRIAKDPSGAWYSRRGQLLSLRGDRENAARDLDEGIRRAPREASLWIARASHRSTIGDAQGAEADLTEAIRLDPSNPIAYNNRGSARMKLDLRDEAIADYSEAVRLDPKHVTSWSNRARVRAGNGDHAGAILDLKEAVKLVPDEADYWTRLGIAYGAVRDADSALAAFTKAIEVDPANASAYGNRGAVELEQKRYKEAVQDLTAYLKTDPEHTLSLQLRGYAHVGLGQWDEAYRDFDRWLHALPASRVARQDRLRAIKAMLQKSPRDPVWLRRLALAPWQTDLDGNVDQAALEKEMKRQTVILQVNFLHQKPPEGEILAPDENTPAAALERHRQLVGQSVGALAELLAVDHSDPTAQLSQSLLRQLVRSPCVVLDAKSMESATLEVYRRLGPAALPGLKSDIAEWAADRKLADERRYLKASMRAYRQALRSVRGETQQERGRFAADAALAVGIENLPSEEIAALVSSPGLPGGATIELPPPPTVASRPPVDPKEAFKKAGYYEGFYGPATDVELAYQSERAKNVLDLLEKARQELEQTAGNK